MFQNMVSIGTGLILLTSQSMQAGVGVHGGDFALFVYYLSFVSSFELLWRIYGAVQADGGLFERMAACCKAPAETLVAHNPLYLNAAVGNQSCRPWSNRAG